MPLPEAARIAAAQPDSRAPPRGSARDRGGRSSPALRQEPRPARPASVEPEHHGRAEQRGPGGRRQRAPERTGPSSPPRSAEIDAPERGRAAATAGPASRPGIGTIQRRQKRSAARSIGGRQQERRRPGSPSPASRSTRSRRPAQPPPPEQQGAGAGRPRARAEQTRDRNADWGGRGRAPAGERKTRQPRRPERGPERRAESQRRSRDEHAGRRRAGPRRRRRAPASRRAGRTSRRRTGVEPQPPLQPGQHAGGDRARKAAPHPRVPAASDSERAAAPEVTARRPGAGEMLAMVRSSPGRLSPDSPSRRRSPLGRRVYASPAPAGASTAEPRAAAPPPPAPTSGSPGSKASPSWAQGEAMWSRPYIGLPAVASPGAGVDAAADHAEPADRPAPPLLRRAGSAEPREGIDRPWPAPVLPRRQQLGAREEEGQLDRRVLRRVAAVDRVALDRRAEELADRPRLGLGDVRRAHHLAAGGPPRPPAPAPPGSPVRSS